MALIFGYFLIQNMIISNKSGIYELPHELPHELPNDLRLWI